MKEGDRIGSENTTDEEWEVDLPRGYDGGYRQFRKDYETHIDRLSEAVREEGLPLSDFVEQGYLNNFLWEQGIEELDRYRRTADEGRDDERIRSAEDVYLDEVEDLLRDRGPRLGMDPELAKWLAVSFTDGLILYADRPPPVRIDMKDVVDEVDEGLRNDPGSSFDEDEIRKQINQMRRLL